MPESKKSNVKGNDKIPVPRTSITTASEAIVGNNSPHSPDTSANRRSRSSSLSHVSGLITVSISGVEVVEGATSTMGRHIEYIIEFKNIATEQKKTVRRRYRQMLQWYHELLAEETIQESAEISFPKQKRITSRGYSDDPKSEFVKSRMIELQTFLRWLFANYQFLYENNATVFFFNLEGFSCSAYHRGSGAAVSSRAIDTGGHIDYEHW